MKIKNKEKKLSLKKRFAVKVFTSALPSLYYSYQSSDFKGSFSDYLCLIAGIELNN